MMRKTLISLILASTLLHADDGTFRERFADPATRTSALGELIPGSREAYFHAALDHQLSGREAAFKETISQWKAATARKVDPISASGMSVLENRQLLISYTKDPKTSLAELIRKLELKFDHARPDAAAATQSLPTRVDPALITAETFEKAAIAASPERPYTQYSERLLRELEVVEQFDEAKVRWFIQNLERADLPGVVPLVDRSLELEPPVAFGSLPLHKNLTFMQLSALLELHPALRSNTEFALSFLRKQLPGTETDFSRDTKAHADHLQRCRDFVVTLPPALNSLKAHVLFHHLRLQAELGRYPKEDFLAFLALPRSTHPLLRIPENISNHAIQLDADFGTATECPIIRDDLPLITDLLQHFLSQNESSAEFSPYIPQKELSVLHAKARLLAGADPDRWGKLIDPLDYKSLLQEVRISFAPGLPQLLDADAAVSLNLDLKNTPDLLVRIYELDLPNQLARTDKEPDVSIDLDGLVPHHERHIKFPNAPIQLHREAVTLPELNGAGAWLVEFVSGQVSARALIRKGQLVPYVERTSTGQVVRVFDEKGNPVLSALAKLGRETIPADASGRIVIPNVANQPVTTGTVQAGKLATKLDLGSRSDDLALDARFHLEREQLLADQETTLRLRVRLTNHGHELPLDRIKDPALVMKAHLLGGVTTERVIADNLKLSPVFEVPFQVPADLLTLSLTLRGTVQPATEGDPLKLSEEMIYEINEDLKGNRVGTAFFSPIAGGHRLEVRGSNGEPLPSRVIHLEFNHQDYLPEIRLDVRTDANGMVDLGSLDTVEYLKASGTDIGETLYNPSPRVMDYTDTLHLPTGTEIRLPLDKPAGAPDRGRISLLEVRDEKPIRDHFDKITIEDGQLLIRGLPPGDHTLTQRGETTRILISAGTEKDGLLISPTRIVPVVAPLHPTIANATTDGGELKVRLRDFGPETRITVTGSRYRHGEWSPGMAVFPFHPASPDVLKIGFASSGFLTDRLLSDEMRYILDRRTLRNFPGSMLPRPGLLLNRWTEEDLSQNENTGSDGSAGRGSGVRSPIFGMNGPGNSKDDQATHSGIPIVCDFLAVPSIVRFNLKPEADGTLSLPLAEFKGSQFLEITATDVLSDDSVVVALPANETPLRDRRIARPLDSKVHYHATRSAAVLAKGAEASIENLLDAEWRAFTTLEQAHQFLYGMNTDERLREFAFLPDWPELSEARKLELLSSHASHELHLFIARKDKGFFDKHVKPHLAQKAEPQFIDDLLLGRDLNTYLRPYAWQRLNAAEKALLAQALPAARERITRELSLRWELEAPGPDAETVLFTQTLRGSDLATEDTLGLARNQFNAVPDDMAGSSLLTEKLRRIIIPRIDFEDTTVEEAVDFLRLRSAELDTLELDPAKRGVNFMIRRPRAGSPPTEGLLPPLDTVGGDPGALRVRELRVRNVPLATALKYICDQAKLRYKVDDFAVTLVPQTETGEDLFTRTYQVPPDFLSKLDAGDSSPAAADPFAEDAGAPGRATLQARKPVISLLRDAGITVGEGASVTLHKGTLLVTNTPTELDKIEQLTEALGVSEDSVGLPAPVAPPPPVVAQGFSEGDSPGRPSVGASDPFAAGDALPRLEIVPRFPDRTRLWREANYFRNTKPTDETLIPLNRFWLDLAAWDGKGAFLSAHFNSCATTPNGALMCLALLDLPFKAEKPEITVDGSSLRVKAREPMVLFYKDTRRTENVAPESPLLVRQTFTPLDEPFRKIDGRDTENFVTGDFRPGVPYRGSFVISNPTGIARRIDLLAQIPAGAIPLDGKTATLSLTKNLKPHGVLMEELAFYFPSTGDFAVYPLHVSEDGAVLAHTPPRTLRVSNNSGPQDAASWLVLANEGTNDQVIARLRTENLGTINLQAIRWRLSDKTFFLAVSKLLRERLHFHPEVSAYGFHHNDVPSIREYLENSTAVRQLGDWLDSPLLEVRPRLHHNWVTLEFDPLINSRTHRFGDESRFTHAEAHTHYQALLDQLGWKRTLDSGDQLNLAAFLFLQDRIEEGLARFGQIDPEKLTTRLQYDYLHAVALFYQEKPADAKAIALRALPGLPTGLWKDRFQSVADQADEIASLAQPAGEATPEKQIVAPELDLVLPGNGKLVIKHRSLAKATLRLFNIDLEVMFSKNPFLLGGDSGNGGEPSIRPNADLEIELPANASETTVELPEAMRKGNVLVSAHSDTKSLLKILDSNAIELRHTPENRTIQVLDTVSAKPLSKTYIKVYAETKDGRIDFHKDGYTDLRGKFDYLSHTGNDPSQIKRLAILANHPEKGARTVIYDR